MSWQERAKAAKKANSQSQLLVEGYSEVEAEEDKYGPSKQRSAKNLNLTAMFEEKAEVSGSPDRRSAGGGGKKWTPPVTPENSFASSAGSSGTSASSWRASGRSEPSEGRTPVKASDVVKATDPSSPTNVEEEARASGGIRNNPFLQADKKKPAAAG